MAGNLTSASKKSLHDDITDFIIFRTSNSPVDRWWRQKHGVAFNSEVHRAISYEDQLFEYYEDQMHAKLEEAAAQNVVNDITCAKKYTPGNVLGGRVNKGLGKTHEEIMKSLDELYK